MVYNFYVTLFVLIIVCSLFRKELYCNIILIILQMPMYLNNIVSRDIKSREKKEYGVYQNTYMFIDMVQLCKINYILDAASCHIYLCTPLIFYILNHGYYAALNNHICSLFR